MSIAIPITAVWIIGFPLFIFMKLFKERKNLNNKDVVLSYGLFFVGLEDNAFYWEIIVTNLRKVVFIVCGTLLGPVNATIKVRLIELRYSVSLGFDRDVNNLHADTILYDAQTIYGFQV